MKFYFQIIILSFLLFASQINIKANDIDTLLIYKFDIKEQIAAPVLRTVQNAMDEAESLFADYIIIEMNTYGGQVDIADSIRTRLINSYIPTIVFVNNQAISAGALISIACDSIYMRQGASIGAATVVSGEGEQMPDKYQSFMRSTMRATAESHGKDTTFVGNDTIISWHRDPAIAEAMVDPKVSVSGLIDSTQVLTLTANEAIELNYCEGTAESIHQILKKYGIVDYEIVEYTPQTIDKAIGLLLNPMVHGLFILLIIGGIYFELQTPGVGFPLIAAVVGAILFFAPLYLEGLAQNWELMVFIIGVVLIALEVFVVPGFGVPGILGVIAIIFGLSFGLVDNELFETNLEKAISDLAFSFMIVLGYVFISLLGAIWLSNRLFSTKRFSRLTLQSEQKPEDGYVAVDVSGNDIVGERGIAHTVLRPSGKVLLNGEFYDAISEIGMIDKNTEVVVVRSESGQIYVEKI